MFCGGLPGSLRRRLARPDLYPRSDACVHSYYVRGAVSPKPGAAEYVPPCRKTYVQKIVELGLIATEVKYPLPRACSSSAA
jgi:hypothetical protein